MKSNHHHECCTVHSTVLARYTMSSRGPETVSLSVMTSMSTWIRGLDALAGQLGDEALQLPDTLISSLAGYSRLQLLC